MSEYHRIKKAIYINDVLEAFTKFVLKDIKDGHADDDDVSVFDFLDSSYEAFKDKHGDEWGDE